MKVAVFYIFGVQVLVRKAITKDRRNCSFFNVLSFCFVVVFVSGIDEVADQKRSATTS